MHSSITRRHAHLVPGVGGLFLRDKDLVLFFLDGSRKQLATSNAAPIFLQPGPWHELWAMEGGAELLMHIAVYPVHPSKLHIQEHIPCSLAFRKRAMRCSSLMSLFSSLSNSVFQMGGPLPLPLNQCWNIQCQLRQLQAAVDKPNTACKTLSQYSQSWPVVIWGS